MAPGRFGFVPQARARESWLQVCIPKMVSSPAGPWAEILASNGGVLL